MTAIVPQTFSQELILPKLVAYFNALPDEQRTFKANDFPIFNVKVIRNGDGSLDLIVGNPDVASPSSNYAGEATFLWIGQRNQPATATAESFFELSKYVNGGTSQGGAVNVRVEVGSYVGAKPAEPIIIPTTGDYTYIATLTDDYGDGWTGNRLMFTINGTSYDTTIQRSVKEQVYIFRANTGVEVRAEFVAEGDFPEECFLNLREVPTDIYPNLDDAVLVYDSNGTGLPNSQFLQFEVPYTPPPALGLVFNQIVTPATPSANSEFANNMVATSNHDLLFVNQPRAGDVLPHIAVYETVSPYGVNTTPVTTIESPNPGDDPFAFNTFGVSSDGTTVAAAGGDNVYVFNRSGNDFVLDGTITAPVANSGFGNWFVGLSEDGNRIAVGAYGEEVSGINSAGAVYIFERYESDWSQVARIQQPTPSQNASFGAMNCSFARTGNLAIIQAERTTPSDSIVTAFAIYNFGNGWEVADLSQYLPFVAGFNGRVMHATAAGNGTAAIAYGNYSRSRLILLQLDAEAFRISYQKDYDNNNVVVGIDYQDATGVYVAAVANYDTNTTTLDWFTPSSDVLISYTSQTTITSVDSAAISVSFVNHDSAHEVALGYGSGSGLFSINAFEEQ